MMGKIRLIQFKLTALELFLQQCFCNIMIEVMAMHAEKLNELA